MLLPLAADGSPGINPSSIAIIVAFGAILFLILHWRRKAVTQQNHPARPAIPSANPLSVREVTSEVQALLGDLEETSRRLAAQLDNRYTRLEQLLAEADERIRRLETLTSPGPGGGAPEPAAPAPAEAPIQSAVGDAQRTLSRLRQERGAPPATADPAYAPIYALSDGGKSPREIAQELGRQPGEVELILALRRRAP